MTTLFSPIDASPFPLLNSSMAFTLLHSALVPASKKPEHWLKMSRWRRYLFSLLPLALLRTISTSPVWEKKGNSFWATCPFAPP